MGCRTYYLILRSRGVLMEENQFLNKQLDIILKRELKKLKITK